MADVEARVTRITLVAITLTAAVMAGTGGYLAGRYARLTPMLPVHFRRGFPDRWVVKSWSLVLMPVAIQAALALIFGAIVALLLWRAAPDVDAAGEDVNHAPRMRVMAEAIALLSFVWIAFQGLAAVQLVGLWQVGMGGLGRVYGLGVVTAIACSVAIGVRAMRAVGRSTSSAADNSPHWRLKVLYVNRADPRLFVPARVGIGYTLNFGRRAAVVLLGLVLLVGVGVPVVIIRLVTR